LLVPWSFV
jgi:hypothetical protein